MVRTSAAAGRRLLGAEHMLHTRWMRLVARFAAALAFDGG
jgi:hypothetical protein